MEIKSLIILHFGQFLRNTHFAPLGLRPWGSMEFLQTFRPAGAMALLHPSLFFSKLDWREKRGEKPETS